MAPNVVVIITDDQPRGLLDAMPIVSAEIKDKGVNLTRGMSPSPLCAMSRASLLTGKYAGHDLGVWRNTGANGGWQALAPHEDVTLATALKDVNYHTGLFGKYTNGWAAYSGAVPPGWDEFRAIKPDDGGDGDYYNYTLAGTGEDEHFGMEPQDYSTDVLAERAENFVLNTPKNIPFLLYFSPYGAHASFIPADRHKGTWPRPTELNPAVNESNEGKARWLRNLPPVDEERVRDVIQEQHETIMSVDEAVGRIIKALTATNRVNNTLFVFLGDNGLQRGQHRLNGKYVPYQASTHLQMLLRWDGGYPARFEDSRITTVMDLTETIVKAAGATRPLANVGTPYPFERHGTLLEGGPGDDDNVIRPAYIGWRTKNYLYIQWATGEEEFYNYVTDPHELVNGIDMPAYGNLVPAYRRKARAAAKPLPPGF